MEQALYLVIQWNMHYAFVVCNAIYDKYWVIVYEWSKNSFLNVKDQIFSQESRQKIFTWQFIENNSLVCKYQYMYNDVYHSDNLREGTI